MPIFCSFWVNEKIIVIIIRQNSRVYIVSSWRLESMEKMHAISFAMIKGVMGSYFGC